MVVRGEAYTPNFEVKKPGSKGTELNQAETDATNECNPLSCRHVTCFQSCFGPTGMDMKRYERVCKPMMEDWQKCYDTEIDKYYANHPNEVRPEHLVRKA